jgi:hypothetical protein
MHVNTAKEIDKKDINLLGIERGYFELVNDSEQAKQINENITSFKQ